MNKSLIAGGSVCLAWAAAAFAGLPEGKDINEWFDEMARAVASLNYEGNFIHYHDGLTENMWVVHRVDEDSVRERLVALDRSGLEIIRDNDTVTCVFAREKTVLVEEGGWANPISTMLPVQHRDLAHSYRVLISGTEQIAGRETKRIEIKPRYTKLYSYRLWMDTETALPLRSETVTDDGDVVERVEFRRISFPQHIPDEMLVAQTPIDGFKRRTVPPPPEPTASDGESDWRVEDLPEGFQMTALYEEETDRAGSEHMVFSDGIASVSVWVEPSGGETKRVSGTRKLGSAYVYMGQLDGYEVTVMGEVPRDIVEQIGKSVSHR